MEETQRFLRYIIPGIVFIIEVSFYLLMSTYHRFTELIIEFGKNIAFPISMVLASGGIGFLLGVIYYTLYNVWPFSLLVVNHLPQINDAVNRGWLILQKRTDENGRKDDVKNVKEELTQNGAWRIAASLWHGRKDSSSRIKGANPFTDRYGNIMHGSGTAFIGSIIAIPFWIFIHAKLSQNCFPYWYFYIIPFLLSGVHLVNYSITSKHFQTVVDIIMMDVLEEEYSKKNDPIVIDVAPCNLKKCNIKS